jgi:hypothetical protein
VLGGLAIFDLESGFSEPRVIGKLEEKKNKNHAANELPPQIFCRLTSPVQLIPQLISCILCEICHESTSAWLVVR